MDEIKYSFDYLLGFYCTPTLAGIKSANLFSLKEQKYMCIKEELEKFNLHFNKKSIYAKAICSCKSNILIFVYNEEILRENIFNPQVSYFLDSLGYNTKANLEENLKHLAKRIRENSDFPHEIGIFLGYPFEDVIAFKENKGQNYLFSGYWKVYTNEIHAKKLFEKFTRCRNNVCNRISNGMLLTQIFNVA